MSRFPNKSWPGLAAAVAAALTFPTIAGAQNFTAVVPLELSIRAGPGPGYPIVAVLPANASITVIGCIDGLSWCDVAYGQIRGWACADYVVYQGLPIPQVIQAPPPVVVFNAEDYWTTNYRDRPFFAERDRWLGGAAGAAGGAVVGALVFGPIGAAVGAAVGGAAGAGAGELVTPPEDVVAYVAAQQPQPVFLQGEVVVGAIVPPVVALQPVPNQPYTYAYINGQWVLVAPDTRQILYIIR
jgi:uncharacterized protein YraI